MKHSESEQRETDDLKDINISNIDRRMLEDFLKVGNIEEAPIFWMPILTRLVSAAIPP